MKIFLTGFMGSGKTTLGKRIAEYFNCQFIDLDEVIRERMNMSIPEIFEEFGEQGFRKVEENAFYDATDTEADFVMATGGGTPSNSNLMESINGMGLSIHLRLLPEELHRRLKKEKKQRPLIADKKKNELRRFIMDKLKERAFFYYQAHWIVHPVGLTERTLIKRIGEVKAR